MNNFWQRTLTGILFVLLIAGGIFFHPFSFFIVFFIVVTAGITEVKTILSKTSVAIDLLSTLLIAVFLFVSTFLVSSGISKSSIYFILIPIVVFLFVRELFAKNENPINSIASSLFSALYVAAPFALLNILAFYKGVYDFKLPLAIFVLVWINDTGAYLSGVSIGKHKFFERISPKKTWEGTIGGFVLTLIVGYVLSLFWANMSGLQWLVFAGLISISAVLGDLIESLFKRSVGIKDSGFILPGHGGILDRFDAVILAIPMAAFFIEFFNK